VSGLREVELREQVVADAGALLEDSPEGDQTAEVSRAVSFVRPSELLVTPIIAARVASLRTSWPKISPRRHQRHSVPTCSASSSCRFGRAPRISHFMT